MKRVFLLMIFLSGAAFAQSPAPKFAFADVHVSAKQPNPFAQFAPPRKGRYEIHNASMVDLIRTAWNVDADKVAGGPSWLEMDRFDLIAKVPEDLTVDTTAPVRNQNALTPDVLRPMLQSLLVERFKLAVHQDTKSLPAMVMTAGKSPHLKAADGSGDTGRKPQSQSATDTPSLNGIHLGPDMTMLYACRNMTMDALAAMISGGDLGPNPVQNKTGLEGKYNFDLKWSIKFGAAIAIPGDNGTRITISEAVEKQLGLKLEQQSLPVTVVIVDSVNEKPAPNPPGTEEALALPPASKTFEVADVKPSDPGSNESSMRTEPSGRMTARGEPLHTMLLFALATGTGAPLANRDGIVDVPKFADDKRFDIIAKGAPDAMGTFNMATEAPMLRSLLEERFGLKTHTEERPLSAYTLIAVKPKLKKADPASRTHCVTTNNPQGAPQGTVVLNCQNITMAQFADQLQNQGQGLNWPLLDSTGLEGGWDFTLTWNRRAGLAIPAARGGGDAPPATNGAAVADDPSGGYTIFEAVEKELGLKLEAQKRPEPVTVIDHLEDHPSDN